MNTKIQFEKDGKKYILEYDRKSIASMERLGFNVNEFGDKPMTMLPLAFKGLFIKNHKFVKDDFIDECFDNFKNKEKLIETIGIMLEETYKTLQSNSDDEGNDLGNIDWETV